MPLSRLASSGTRRFSGWLPLVPAAGGLGPKRRSTSPPSRPMSAFAPGSPSTMHGHWRESLPTGASDAPSASPRATASAREGGVGSACCELRVDLVLEVDEKPARLTTDAGKDAGAGAGVGVGVGVDVNDPTGTGVDVQGRGGTVWQRRRRPHSARPRSRSKTRSRSRSASASPSRTRSPRSRPRSVSRSPRRPNPGGPPAPPRDVERGNRAGDCRREAGPAVLGPLNPQAVVPTPPSHVAPSAVNRRRALRRQEVENAVARHRLEVVTSSLAAVTRPCAVSPTRDGGRPPTGVPVGDNGGGGGRRVNLVARVRGAVQGAMSRGQAPPSPMRDYYHFGHTHDPRCVCACVRVVQEHACPCAACAHVGVLCPCVRVTAAQWMEDTGGGGGSHTHTHTHTFSHAPMAKIPFPMLTSAPNLHVLLLAAALQRWQPCRRPSNKAAVSALHCKRSTCCSRPNW